MALLVEDGTGTLAADALISRAFFIAYCAAKGYDLTGKDGDTDIDPAIRRGSSYVSDSFAWSGTRLTGRTQVFAFPRYSMTDAEGWAVPSNAVPVEVQRAVAEAAWYELNNPFALSPTVVPSDRVVEEQVGSLRVRYAGVSQGADAALPVLTILRTILKGLLPTGGSSYSGSSVRA